MKLSMFLLIGAAVFLHPALAQRRPNTSARSAMHSVNGKISSGDLDTGLAYEESGDFKSAETYFSAAAKDDNTREQGLAGLRRATSGLQRAQDEADKRSVQLGDLYKSQHLWVKAEEFYKTALASKSEQIRRQAFAGLGETISKQAPKAFGEFAEFAKSMVEILVLVLALALLGVYSKNLIDRRKGISIIPFKAPSDDIAKKVAFSIAYARAQLQNPSSSPTLSSPASLWISLPTFIDELPEIEDLEIAGAKIPFAALSRLVARPATEVNGGYDGNAPTGSGYAVVKTRRYGTTMHQWPVRGTSQADLVDFAYHVLVETISAHADE